MTDKISKNSQVISIILILILIAISVLSIKWAAPKYSNPEERKETIEYLDQQRNTVLALTTASTTASTALTLLKDDWATPIANELAELSVYFMVILAAIVLEKYLITLSGLIVFQYVVPAACILLIIYILFQDMEWTKKLAIKLFAFGFVLFMLVPASVQVCQIIEDTHGTSIQAALESAENAAALAESETVETESIWGKVVSSVTEKVSAAIDSVKNILNNFIEAVAIMMITSCVIPVLMIVIFVWLLNTLAGLNITLPAPVRVKVDTEKRKISFPEE